MKIPIENRIKINKEFFLQLTQYSFVKFMFIASLNKIYSLHLFFYSIYYL